MKLTQLIRHVGLILSLTCSFATAYAAFPLWTFSQNINYPSHISINPNQTATVVYTVQNQSSKAKTLVMKTIPGVVQVYPCQLAPLGQPGSSCSLILSITANSLSTQGVHNGPILCQSNSNGTPNSNQCYQPSAADSLNITLTPPQVGVTISVNPFILLMAEHSTEDVTVTNDPNSSAAAHHVTATPPAGSSISVQSTSCGQSLAIGASCHIVFASTTTVGPTIIPVQGDNTNTVNVYAAVTDQPLISITTPVQQNRIVSTDGVTALDLGIQNDQDSVINANDITVSDKSSCPNLSVDASNCTSVAPGMSCYLHLRTITPYAPCTITVSGHNTGNSPTTLLAFSYLGGLVFQTSGANGQVVIDAGSEFISEWTFPSRSDIPGALSATDGLMNTHAIVADAACTNQPGHCAAARCRAIGADWYLPAQTQLQNVIFALCPGSVYPCDFGALSSTFYWSSTQWSVSNTFAYSIDVPDGNSGYTDKWSAKPVRCIRDF